MAVNFTTYIALAKPTEDELALNWTRSADLIEDNNNIIADKLDLTFQSHSPAFIGRVSNPSFGSGSITTEFIEYEGFIFGFTKIIFSGTVSAGSGEWGIALPFNLDSYHATGTALNDNPGQFDCLGEGYFNDSSAVGTSGSLAVDAVVVSGVTYARLVTETFGGKAARVVGSASPVAIASGDSISFSYTFKKA